MAHFNRIGMSVAGTERIIKAYGIDEQRMGLVYSAFLLFYTLAMLPGGWFIDRFGPRMALMMLCFGSSVFVAMTGAVGLLARGPLDALGGAPDRAVAARAGQRPAASGVGPDGLRPGTLPTSRAMANGLVTFAACVGIAATFYVLGKLIDLFDWPIAFVISGGMTLLVALVWTFGTRPAGGDSVAAAVTRCALRSLGLLADPAASRRDLHHARLRGLRLFPVPVLLLDPVLLRDDAEGGSTSVARVQHDDHPRDGVRHAQRRMAGRSRPAVPVCPDCRGAGAGAGDDRQRNRLRAGPAGAGCPGDPGGVHALGRPARALRGRLLDDGRRARPTLRRHGRRA